MQAAERGLFHFQQLLRPSSAHHHGYMGPVSAVPSSGACLREVHRQPRLSEKDVKVLRSLLPKLINNYSSHTTRITFAV
ncbi:Toll-Interacting Protein [Manis pentadactyla]|nr:Toll-Interacting Protein [Manis pentadactyla]